MSVKDDLEIFLITYNRKNHFERTCQRLFEENSPIKDFDIKILDNESDDGTSESAQKIMEEHSNVTYIRNKYNLGISGNITKAMEMASKKWLWIICDDDDFDWSNWGEVESALHKDYDIVMNSYTDGMRSEEYPYLINEMAFIPNVIYNTKHIDRIVIQNAYALYNTLLPHHAIGCKVINENGKIFVPQNKVSVQYYEDKNNFVRKLPKENMYHRLKNFNVFWAYIESYQLIKDKKMRHACCDVLWLGESFYHSMKAMLDMNVNPYYIFDIFMGVNSRQKRDLLKACLRYFYLNKIRKIRFYSKEKEGNRRKIKIFFGLIRISYQK